MLRELLTILLLPLAAFVVQIAIGRRLPRQGDLVSVVAIGGSFLLAAKLFAATFFAGGGAALLLAGGALGAALGPAYRASPVNPTDALRFE